MMKTNKKTRNLSFGAETIRRLDSNALAHVGGGLRAQTVDGCDDEDVPTFPACNPDVLPTVICIVTTKGY